MTPGGSILYALRSALDSPPQVVRLDATAPDQPTFLKAPGQSRPLPGTLTELLLTTDHGFADSAPLILPEDAGPDDPSPLLVEVHGGPQLSWSGWPWQWNPWPFVARGYAVLLPDPARPPDTGSRCRHADAASTAAGPTATSSP